MFRKRGKKKEKEVMRYMGQRFSKIPNKVIRHKGMLRILRMGKATSLDGEIKDVTGGRR